MIVGHGLHSGKPSAVRFASHSGAIVFRIDGDDVPISALDVVDTSRSTTIARRGSTFRIATVEHLFAALLALRIRDGVRIELSGPEIPLADGGAALFYDALSMLGVTPKPPMLVVARSFSVSVGQSRYEFAPAPNLRIDVEVDFGDARLAKFASWNGNADDFRTRIAPARTFGFAHEVAGLVDQGLASHALPESVVVIGERIFSAGPPFAADEPARHKLLDVMGDLYAHAGLVVGAVKAYRPGHAATHEAMVRAFEAGAVAKIAS